MSIKLMSQVWERKLGKAEQSVLLAMADYADDDGRNCYPSYARLAWKTGYSARQVGRIVTGLVDKGIAVILKPSTQHQSTHYWLRLDKAEAKEPFRVDILDTESSIDNLSTLNDDDESSMDTMSTLNDSRVDISDTEEIQGGHLRHPGWTSATSSIDTMSTNPSVNHHINQTEEKEEAHARDPLSVAWRQTYADVALPPVLEKSLQKLVAECGMAAAIHGIKASAAKEDGRNYRYIAECARNYVPPPPLASYASGSVYSNDAPDPSRASIPGVVTMPATNGHAPPLPPPMPTDDPWAIALAELQSANLPWAHWLTGSFLQANGELAGEPFYRLTLTEPGANAEWLTQQAESFIRRKLASILGKRITLEITTGEKVTV